MFSKDGWDPKYGKSWYLHFDGRPHLDDDDSYLWKNCRWVHDNEYDDVDETCLEEYEEKRRQKLAESQEF